MEFAANNCQMQVMPMNMLMFYEVRFMCRKRYQQTKRWLILWRGAAIGASYMCRLCL